MSDEHNSNAEKFRKLQAECNDFDIKLRQTNKLVDELRAELSKVRDEALEYKRDRDEYVDDLDTLEKTLELRDAEIDKLNSEIQALLGELQMEREEKYDLISKCCTKDNEKAQE